MVQAEGVRGRRVGVWITGSLALVAAVAALVVLAGPSGAPTMLEDDVTHDAQMSKMFGKHTAGERGRKALRASSSIQDFFHAAMRGDFEDGKKVKLATSGLFDHQEQRKEAHEAAPSKASKQQLAEGKLRLKAAHQALAKVAHAEAKQGQMHPMMERPMQRHFVRSREAAIRAKYPTEDRFVARYTGAIPSGDVVVDTFTGGPYVPV